MNQYGQFKKRADPQHVEGGVTRGGAGEIIGHAGPVLHAKGFALPKAESESDSHSIMSDSLRPCGL